MLKRHSTRVLILSEYPVVRAGLRSMLESPGVRVVGEAATAEEGLVLLERRRFDLLVAACHGGECELVRFAKEKHPAVSVLFVAMSDRSLSLSRAVALGCSGYLARTMTRAELLKALRGIARGECVVEPRLLRELLQELRGAGGGAAAPSLEQITPSERDVLRFITEGRTNREIAAALGYSVGTVKDYVQRIIHKLGVSDRTQAAVKAVRLGMLE